MGLTFLFVLWPFRADDAFIAFRYSDHLARGLGPVWNTSGHPVEGYTSLTWMLVLAGTALVHIGILGAAKTFGALSLFATVLALRIYGERLTGHRSAGQIAAGGLLLFPAAYVHAVSGMETTFYAMLLTLLVLETVCVLRGARSVLGAHRRPHIVLPLLALLVSLTRPEGVVVAVLSLVAGGTAPPAATRRAVATGLALFAVPYVAFLGWRLRFYGWPLPNTFYVKTDGSGVEPGVNWLGGQLQFLAPLLVAVGVGALLTRRSGRRWRDRLPALYVAVALASAVVPYAFGSQLTDFHHRFLMHSLPVWFVLVGVVVTRVASSLRTVTTERVTFVGLLPAIVLAVPLLTDGRIASATLTSDHASRSTAALGRGLHDMRIPEGDRSLAIEDAGEMPFLSDWRTLDLLGLNDEALAHGNAMPLERFLAERPTVLIFNTTGDGVEIPPYDALDGDVIGIDYEPVGTVQFYPRYFYGVWVARSAAPATKDALTALVRRLHAESLASNGSANHGDVGEVLLDRLWPG